MIVYIFESANSQILLEFQNFTIFAAILDYRKTNSFGTYLEPYGFAPHKSAFNEKPIIRISII